MKHKLPVIFAILSGMLLAALIIVGLVSPGNKTDKLNRLFGTSAAAAQEQDEAGEVPESPAAETSQPDSAEDIVAEPVPVDTPAEESVQDEAYEEQEPQTEPEIEEAQREPLEKYDNLLEINPYVSGWLRIDDSSIDDPVVYTPKSQNYFLHRAVDGSDDEKGTFFIAVNWQDGYNQTLIYGHNMRDGSGFGSLAKFAKKSFWESHPVIHFDTLYEEREYEVFAAFYSQIDEEELETEEDRAEADKAIEEESIAKKEEEGESAAPETLTLKDMDLYVDLGDVDVYRQEKDEDNGRFRYYYYTDLADKADFDYFVQNVKERALYDTGVEAEWGDELITLSTCSYHVKNGRFILVGVRKKT
ncbi:MAG: class B sortase [Lachnospiraceae bacterium]|nr:class B sortase [Lachnospiraceae bacterium]